MKTLQLITHRETRQVLYSCFEDSLSKTVERALQGKVNLRWADLRWANLSGADLGKANLSGANLRGADLPALAQIEKMQIRAAICEKVCVNPDALEMSRWHSCETVHCIAGWTVTLHPQGRLLESIYGPSAAAALILHVCEGEVPDFHADNETAMRWIKGEA